MTKAGQRAVRHCLRCPKQGTQQAAGPRFLAVYCPVGGVGRTTLAVNLACQLAASRTVQLIDADERGVAVDWIGAGRLPIGGEGCPLEDDKHAAAWTRRISALSTNADVVIIDLPPRNGAVVRAATKIADLVLIPVPHSPYGRRVAASALEWLDMQRDARQDGEPAILLLPSRVRPNVRAERAAQSALQGLGAMVGPTIKLWAAYATSARVHDWVGHCAPRSAACREMVALAACIAELAQV